MIANRDRKELLTIARLSMEAAVRGETFEPAVPASGPLSEIRGAFVTLTSGGMLRGCIGRVTPDTNLAQVVADMARAAAISDPRFPPVEEGELDGLSIEVSALTPLKSISGPDEIEVGRDGLVVREGYRSGLLLPQVAGEFDWAAERFLAETCLKAGLPENAWQRGAEIESFQAEVWSE